MPNIRWLIRLITHIHRFVLVKSGGRIGHKLGGMEMLLLDNVGRKSGTLRHTPLLFIEEEGRFVVVASNGGDDRNPAWLLNVRAHPETSAMIRGRRTAVKARVADADERAPLWERLDASYPYYPDYRARASREIPIVLLEPTATETR